MTEATGNADYDSLPAAIRMRYTLAQWLWLSDGTKAGLLTAETEPEWEE